jgi:ATP-binding protein involved in chromosome partitioning
MLPSNVMNESAIQTILQKMVDPYLEKDWGSAGILKSIEIEKSAVMLHLKFSYPISLQHQEKIIEKIKAEIAPLLEDKTLTVKIDWKVNSHLAQAELKGIPGIKNILAVASGKGGVGKSTVSLSLALALQQEGARVGILDADIYGPSQPIMLGIQEKPGLTEDKRLQPVVRYGLQTMSIGYLVDESAAMIWRGPMVSSALQQLLTGTAWDNLDYLIVDLPPGTGDIQLTLAQKIPVSGVVIVTTPQTVAVSDAKKACAMMQKLGISILGIVENMSVHVCTACGHEAFIFGKEGGKELSAQYAAPLLGQLPLDNHVRECSDKGIPLIIDEPSNKIVYLYQEIARKVSAKLSLTPRDYRVAITATVS